MSIKYPLNEKLVTDWELESHLILEFRDLPKPDVCDRNTVGLEGCDDVSQPIQGD